MLRFFYHYNRLFRQSNNKTNNRNKMDYKHQLLENKKINCFPLLTDYHSMSTSLFKHKDDNCIFDYNLSSSDDDTIKNIMSLDLKGLIVESRNTSKEQDLLFNRLLSSSKHNVTSE